MPLNRPALSLGSGPRGVQDARRWVVDTCRDIGRDDLVECAELGVSELVTNALLHGADPISVRVRGTKDHLRIEVWDGSRKPPSFPNPSSADPDDMLQTFGRGLSLVAMCATNWGVSIEAEGKFVWFEPSPSPGEGDVPTPDLNYVEQTVPIDVTDNWVEVVFDNVPMGPLIASRRHFRELRRELRLLSLSHRDDYPLAGELTRVFADFDASFDNTVVGQIERLVRSRVERGFLRARFNPSRSTLVDQMLRLLNLADEFAQAQRLLSLARTDEVRQFQIWYFSEFVRQARGEAPRPCPVLSVRSTEPAQ